MQALLWSAWDFGLLGADVGAGMHVEIIVIYIKFEAKTKDFQAMSVVWSSFLHGSVLFVPVCKIVIRNFIS